jgi:hypothetical protein
MVSCWLEKTILIKLHDLSPNLRNVRRLMRHLKMSGFPSRQIGDVVDFHGNRAPFHLCSQDVIQSLPPDTRRLYDYIYAQIRDSVELRCEDIMSPVPPVSASVL